MKLFSMTALFLVFSNYASADSKLPQPLRYAKGICESFLMLTPDLPGEIDRVTPAEGAKLLARNPELAKTVAEYLETAIQVVPFGATRDVYLAEGIQKGFRTLMNFSTDLAARTANQMVASMEPWSVSDGFVALALENLALARPERTREFISALVENPAALEAIVGRRDFSRFFARLIEKYLVTSKETHPRAWDLFRIGFRVVNARGAASDAAHGKRVAELLRDYFGISGDVMFKILFEQTAARIPAR
jgi:hypothetical protein